MISSLSELVSQFTGYPEHMAVVNDDIEALDAALAAVDGDRDVAHHDGNTPLMLAIRLHRTRMVEHLISVGANVNFASTAVVAAAHGNERIMAMLLAAGAAVRTDLYHANMLFDCAAQNADAGVLRVLVGAGAPVDEPNARGKLPIDFAAENENEEVLSVLLAAGCSVKSSADLAVLAARNRNHKVLAMLMKAGVDINKCDQKSSFPIHHAAQNPNVAVVRLLIDAGVDVNVLDCNDENPLLNACTNPNMEVFDALLTAGAEWVEVSKLRSICHAVALNTNEAIVRRVIERGFDVNALESNGMTPLMFAAESSTVSVFLEAGADVNAIDCEGKSVCQYACLNKNAGIMRVLIAAGARFDIDVLKAAVDESNVDVTKALIDAGMNVADAVNANPRILFHLSNWPPSKAEMLEFLNRCGVDFRVVQNGQTLCHVACLAGFDEWLPVLFAHGADLDAKDSEGQTPIQVAEANVTLTLISAGIDVSQRRQFEEREHCFLAAVGHPEVPVDSVPRRQLAWACNQIAERQFDLLRLRAFQVCVGLEGRQLPALVTCEILAHAFAPLESLVAFHRVWAIVTTIKHFARD